MISSDTAQILAAWVQVFASIGLVLFTIWFQDVKDEASRAELQRATLTILHHEFTGIVRSLEHFVRDAENRDAANAVVTRMLAREQQLVGPTRRESVMALARGRLDSRQLALVQAARDCLDNAVMVVEAPKFPYTGEDPSGDISWNELHRLAKSGLRSARIVLAHSEQAAEYAPATVGGEVKHRLRFFRPFFEFMLLVSA
ncbi:hypothetical protein [Salinisphaera hydrothermalis]|uniref:hypothetical protein n=1 Tax=Salinisphaera hydrothermalis TaxID=563188 RepID=UPI003341F04C